MNFSDWAVNFTSPASHTPILFALDDRGVDTTGTPYAETSDKPCGDALSSQTPGAVKLPGSLDALLYIVIVLMFYAFSIVVLMVKYIRREREEANLRNYYHEFVSREKFRSAQYKNRQFMKRIFGRGGTREDNNAAAIEDDCRSISPLSTGSKYVNQAQTMTRNGNTFSRLLVECEDDKKGKESFTFLSAKNQFCKKGFFGKKFCNKQLCSKCVSEGAPTIDWGDGRSEVPCNNHKPKPNGAVEIRLYNNPGRNSPVGLNSLKGSDNDRFYMFERDNSIFFPIIECDSERDSDEANKSQNIPLPMRGSSESRVYRSKTDCRPEEQAIVSSCSLEVSELLANMPPLGALSTSNDMDTLDGLSNLDSEAESQSLLNYSTSMRGMNNVFASSQNGDSPRGKPHSTTSDKREPSCDGDGRHKDLSDFLSERTSLLSCTLSIANEVEDDDGTNHSSSKHGMNGFTHSNSNGKIKEELKTNGKSILNSLSKSVSNDEEEMMKLLSNITMLTEDSGVFKNLKYFLRSFSKQDEEDLMHEKSNLLPKETYFGPGSPKSIFEVAESAVVPTHCDQMSQRSDYGEMDEVDNDLLNMDDCENYGNRWGYTYDDDDEIYSEGGKSSSFGEYCMGEASESQVIDLSKPLVRRQLDTQTRDGLSRAFIGLEDPWHGEMPQLSKPNPMVAGYGSARKETKV